MPTPLALPQRNPRVVSLQEKTEEKEKEGEGDDEAGVLPRKTRRHSMFLARRPRHSPGGKPLLAHARSNQNMRIRSGKSVAEKEREQLKRRGAQTESGSETASDRCRDCSSWTT